ncbi:MAG TPA: PPOX class F420-dependent oxidoreductase [Methanotrichaceae archaeon]|nr:PPOX class F420-dependent oxidoreductase [Methanotrichaceae archaeon]
MVTNPKLDQFLNMEYMRLETFKRSGQSVATPVWFVDDGQVIYVRSYANSGKVKRMRNNPHVRFAPSDPLGHPKGVTIEGNARLVDGMKSVQVSQLLYRKYGLMKMSFDLWGRNKAARLGGLRNRGLIADSKIERKG